MYNGGQKYIVVDGLFQRPLITVDIVEAEIKKNSDDFNLIEVNSLQVLSIFLDEPTPILVNNYFDNS